MPMRVRGAVRFFSSMAINTTVLQKHGAKIAAGAAGCLAVSLLTQQSDAFYPLVFKGEGKAEGDTRKVELKETLRRMKEKVLLDHGALTAEEWHAFLHAVDTNNDNCIDRNEWNSVFGPDGFDEVDINNDNKIEISEWTLYAPKFGLLHHLSRDSDEGTADNAQQVGGHAGGFRPGLQPGRILKKTNELEVTALESLCATDAIAPYVVKFFGKLGAPIVEKGGVGQWIEMENLLLPKKACVMDCKIGGRTFLESEASNQKLRPDLAQKMVNHSPGSLSPEEVEKGITKLRYMQFRDETSSIAGLKFRIEGYTTKPKDQPDPIKADKIACQKLCHAAEVQNALAHFLSTAPPGAKEKIVQDLKDISNAISKSEFFANHELIGSSLLFVYDPEGTYAKVKIIDFGKTGARAGLKHNVKWEPGNHEDEYAIGVGNLSKLIESI